MPSGRVARACLCLVVATNAVIPDGELEVSDGPGSAFVAPGFFGDRMSTLPEKASALKVELRRPDGLADGCAPAVARPAPAGRFALLAARSPNCTFDERARAAEALGASALVVYNTLEGMYRNRSSGESKADFECRRGRSWEPSRARAFEGYADSACARVTTPYLRRCSRLSRPLNLSLKG